MEWTTTPIPVDNLDPKLWGRNTWEFLEMIVLTYPEKDPPQEKKDAVFQLLENLGKLLPCQTCREHYKVFFEAVMWEKVLAGRCFLFEFYYELRKDVAQRSQEEFGKATRDDAWKKILQKFHLYVPSKAESLRNRMRPVTISTLPNRPNERKKIPIVSLASGCNCGK